jgi:UDP-N-acetyl-2-amino-2-deoxyglucuronate dehydrogenase
MKKFAIIGASGYIAPRHLKAIKETDNELVVALDKFDSVGIIDSYFPNANFFTEFERFDRYIEKLKYSGKKLDFISICTPNYLHDSHIRMALRRGADAICEKPLVLNPWNIDALSLIEKESGNKINTILQLRLLPSLISLKKRIDSSKSDKKFDVDLTYITSRGNWYNYSWKGDEAKSGGIATNIGIHFYDLLGWIFGDILEIQLHSKTKSKASGYIEFAKARVRWFLSIDENDLPESIRKIGQRTFRSIKIDDSEIEFSHGFNDLHTESYKNILLGKGFGLEDARKSVELVHEIRNSKITKISSFKHHFLK